MVMMVSCKVYLLLIVVSLLSGLSSASTTIAAERFQKELKLPLRKGNANNNIILPQPNINSNDRYHDQESIGIAAYRDEYTKEPLRIPSLSRPKRSDSSDHHDHHLSGGSWDGFHFGRFQSPEAVQDALSHFRKHKFKHFQGKAGRQGMVTSTKLGGDWVMAESTQTAVGCTSQEVLRAYLSSKLQKTWNPTQVLECTIIPKQDPVNDDDNDQCPSPYYQQDLVLHSQRVIRSHTGIMKYSQRITVDQIGEGAGDYCVSVKLDPSEPTTPKKPFEKLNVYVSLKETDDGNVDIYAAGIMKVNRQVVPNLIVFDASGIAGSMAGKGTLWLAAYFDELKSNAVQTIASATPVSSMYQQYVGHHKSNNVPPPFRPPTLC